MEKVAVNSKSRPIQRLGTGGITFKCRKTPNFGAYSRFVGFALIGLIALLGRNPSVYAQALLSATPLERPRTTTTTTAFEMHRCNFTLQNVPTNTIQRIKFLGPAAKQTVILIHGLQMQAGDMHGISEKYDDGETNILAINLPLHKNATIRQWRTTVSLAIFSTFAWGQPITLSGFSLGGLLALDYYFRFPGAIANLELLAPAIEIHPRLKNLIAAIDDPRTQRIIERLKIDPEKIEALSQSIEKIMELQKAVMTELERSRQSTPLSITLLEGDRFVDNDFVTQHLGPYIGESKVQGVSHDAVGANLPLEHELSIIQALRNNSPRLQ